MATMAHTNRWEFVMNGIKTLFITGVSSGFGNALAQEALAAGDVVGPGEGQQGGGHTGSGAGGRLLNGESVLASCRALST